MRLDDALRALEATPLHRAAAPDAVVRQVVAADLMSDVLTVDADHLLILTALATEQTVRTAHLLGAVAVVLTGNKAVPATLSALAAQLGVTLARTALPQFEACVALGRELSA